MEAEVIYNPGKTKGLMKSFKNKLFGSSQPKELTDILAISIYAISDQEGGSPQRVPLSSGSGSWLSHIEFDGVKYWDVEQRFPEWEMPTERDGGDALLESDSSKRADYESIKEKNFDQADT